MVNTASEERVQRQPGGSSVLPPASLNEFTRAERDRMVTEHLPLVRHVARRIHMRLPRHVEMDDLISAGVLGLLDASAKYRPDRKVAFSSYAQFRIRGAIIDSLRAYDWGPRELRRKARRVEEASRKLIARLGRAPLGSEIASELGISLGTYQDLRRDLNGLEVGPLSLDQEDGSGDGMPVQAVADEDTDPLHRCLRSEIEDSLADAMDRLPERERVVMNLYYREERTMREIGLALGVVESRISQMHASAVTRLRAGLRDLGLRNRAGRDRNLLMRRRALRPAPGAEKRPMKHSANQSVLFAALPSA